MHQVRWTTRKTFGFEGIERGVHSQNTKLEAVKIPNEFVCYEDC